MNITLLGIIVIAMSIYAFFKNEKLLLYMLVFFSTFTAAELFHIEFISAPVLPFEFIGTMWLLKQLINFIKSKPKITKEIIINKFKENKLATACLIFIIAVILGEAYLAISGITIDYISFYGKSEVIRFSMGNISQFIIITFIFTLMIVLSFKIKTKEEIKTLLKVFCISSIFAVIWGLLQFITFYFGIPYPAFLFNNNVYAAQCYDQIGNNIKRISSIALEPSTFSINLICFMPFLIGTFLKLKENFKDKKYLLIFVLLVLTTVCAILTTSSTAYVGLVALYGMFGLYILCGFIKNGELSDRKKNFIKLALITVISILLAVVLWFTFVKIGYKMGVIKHDEMTLLDIELEEENPKVDDRQHNSIFDNMISTIKQMTIGKLASASGQDRMQGDLIGFSMIKYSPIVGIGFGAYRPFSMFTNVLLGSGVIRIISFCIYILYCA